MTLVPTAASRPNEDEYAQLHCRRDRSRQGHAVCEPDLQLSRVLFHVRVCAIVGAHAPAQRVMPAERVPVHVAVHIHDSITMHTMTIAGQVEAACEQGGDLYAGMSTFCSDMPNFYGG